MAKRQGNRWTKRRVLTRVIALLALGFIINVLVAWGIAALFAHNPTAISGVRTRAASTHANGWTGRTIDGVYAFVEVKSVLGVDEITMRTRLDKDFDAEELPTLWRLNGRHARTPVPRWRFFPIWALARLGIDDDDPLPVTTIERWTAFGVPLRSFATHARSEAVLGDQSSAPWPDVRFISPLRVAPAPSASRPLIPPNQLAIMHNQALATAPFVAYPPLSEPTEAFYPVSRPLSPSFTDALLARVVPGHNTPRSLRPIVVDYEAIMKQRYPQPQQRPAPPPVNVFAPRAGSFPLNVVVHLPTRPLVEGVLINTLFYAALIGAPLHAHRIVRTTLRLRRGRCVHCGYDLCHNYASGCSECGWKKPEVPGASAKVAG